MTSHRYHPDISLAGLDADCERCQELAEHPDWYLDSMNLQRLSNGLMFSELDRVAYENFKKATER